MNKKINIPVNIVDEEYTPYDSDVILNTEETPTSKIQEWGKKENPNNKYFFLVAFIFILLLAIIFFMASNSPTIEDLRKEKLIKLNEDLKVKTWLMNWYLKLFNENKIKVENLKNCIEKNSITWTVVDCNL